MLRTMEFWGPQLAVSSDVTKPTSVTVIECTRIGIAANPAMAKNVSKSGLNCDNRYANRRAPAGAFLVPIFGRTMICILGEPLPTVIAVRIFAPGHLCKET